MKKKLDDTKLRKFMGMFKQLFVNIPLFDALLPMLCYDNFKKDLITKEQIMNIKIVKIINMSK